MSENENSISNKQNKLQKLEARQKATAAMAQKLQKSIEVIKRKRELQRKILVGTYYLEEANKNGTLQELQQLMLNHLKNERDKNLFKVI